MGDHWLTLYIHTRPFSCKIVTQIFYYSCIGCFINVKLPSLFQSWLTYFWFVQTCIIDMYSLYVELCLTLNLFEKSYFIMFLIRYTYKVEDENNSKYKKKTLSVRIKRNRSWGLSVSRLSDSECLKLKYLSVSTRSTLYR